MAIQFVHTLTVDELEKIGNEMFPDTNGRWGSKLARLIGMSPAAVTSMRHGTMPISEKSAQKITEAYARWKFDDVPHHDASNSEYRGEASFGLSLVAKDLISNKFVAVHKVNPALFFPEFAPEKPATEKVVYVKTDKSSPEVQVHYEDDALPEDEILERIEKRFRVMETMVDGIISGTVPSMIISGAPGVGKSFNVMKKLQESGIEYDVVKGAVKAPGIIQALFRRRDGGVVVFDDADGVFGDEEALNILKAALDSEKTRRISWRKQSPWLSDFADREGVDVSELRNFDFMGGVVFISNKNIKALARREDRMSPHFKALVSRSMFIDLTLESPKAKLAWCKKIFFETMATEMGLTNEDATEITDFIGANVNRFDEISFRTVKMAVGIYKTDPENWKDILEITKMS